MSEVKLFRVTLRYTKRHKTYLVKKDYRALKPEHALEFALSDTTSKGLFRRQIKVEGIEEISVDETKDYVIRALSEQ
ncbi:MAG: 50S ribosomal protein L18Ae [Promethearchaeota archaeon]